MHIILILYTLLKIEVRLVLTGGVHTTSRLYRPLRSSGDGKGNEIHRSRAGGYEGVDGEK